MMELFQRLGDKPHSPLKQLFLKRKYRRIQKMADVTAKMVKELREMTGVGMMDAKRALVEVEGDMEKAVDLKINCFNIKK